MVLAGNVLGVAIRGGYTEGCRVRNSSALDIVKDTETTILFDTEDYDTDDIHSTTLNTGRLTCKTLGKYDIRAAISWESNATGYRQIIIKLNGTTYIAAASQMGASAIPTRMQVSTKYDLEVGDYVEFRGSQHSGGNLESQVGGSFAPLFEMQRIG